LLAAGKSQRSNAHPAEVGERVDLATAPWWIDEGCLSARSIDGDEFCQDSGVSWLQRATISG
jgi:hypothetical protein